MSEILNITKTEGKVTILHLEGSLDGQTEKMLVDLANAEFDSGTRALVLDLSKLEIITSAGLRAIHAIYKTFTPEAEIRSWKAEHPDDIFKSPYFKLAQPLSQIHYVLSMSGFLQSLYIYPTLQEAVDSFSA